MMRRHREGSRLGLAPRSGLFPLALGLGLILLGAAWAPAARAAAWAPDPISWTNGVTLCDFASSSPSVNVSALARSGSGLSVEMDGLAEIAPNGSVVATAEMSSASWHVANESDDDDYDLAFTATVSVVLPSGAAKPVGSVELGIDYILPAYEATSSTALNVVAANVSVANWTWQHVGDALRATFAVGPTYPEAEHLGANLSGSWMFTSVGNDSGQPFEWMTPGTSATVWSPSTGFAVDSATPSRTIHSPSAATLTVDFGSGSGEYQTLNYTSDIGVVLPATIAGIPIADFAIAAGAAVVASLALAGVARRARRGRSQLIYAEEEEP